MADKNKNFVEINKFGQGLIELGELTKKFDSMDSSHRQKFFNDLLFLILQSKPISEDIDNAISMSNLKPTYTPCVLIKKGVEMHQLEKLTKLPSEEWNKVFMLLMCLFKLAYIRKLKTEKDKNSKWWFDDMSNY